MFRAIAEELAKERGKLPEGSDKSDHDLAHMKRICASYSGKQVNNQILFYTISIKYSYAYGWQGPAGRICRARIQFKRVLFGVSSMPHFSPLALSSDWIFSHWNAHFLLLTLFGDLRGGVLLNV